MTAAELPPALEVYGLVKSFGDTAAVDGLDLLVPRGTVLALLGPNGAGKTTTVELCEGFLEPDEGSVRVLGLDPRTHRQEIRNRVGMMLQGGGAYPSARVGEMLRLVASYFADPLDTSWLLDVLGMSAHERTPYRRLSGGQQQRLSLACAVVGRPELVFLDEPTAGLDAQSRRGVWELVNALRRDGVGVVLTTHLMDEAESLADDVVIIDHGRCVARGAPAELLRAGASEGVIVTTDTPWSAGSLALRLGTGHRVTAATGRTGLEVVGRSTPRLWTAICRAAEEDEVRITSLRSRSSSLEEIYLDLTGRELR